MSAFAGVRPVLPAGPWARAGLFACLLCAFAPLAAEPLPALAKGGLGGRKFSVLSDTALVRGGITEKYLLGDDHKDVWLFKPMKPDLAYTEEAAARLARRFGLATPEVFAVRLGRGMTGSLARIIECQGNLKAKPPAALDARQKEQLLQLQVFRWLIGDFDTHCRNFLVDPAGNIVTIDHGRAFREVDLFAYDLTPGKAYSGLSYYWALWDEYAKGRIELPLDRTFEFIDRLAAVPDREVDAILRPMAAMKRADRGYVLKNQYGEVVFRTEDEFLFAVSRRRRDLRAGFARFYDLMARARGLAGYQAPAPARVEPAPAAGEPVDAEPLPIEVQDDRSRLSPTSRAGKQIQMWVESIQDGGIPRALTHVGVLFQGGLSRLGHALESAVSGGLTTREVAELDLAHLPGGKRFLGRLRQSRPEVVALLRTRTEYLGQHATTPIQTTNATRLLAWIDFLAAHR